MSLPTYTTITTTIPYTATDAASIQAVRDLATFIARIPGLVFDDTKTTINSCNHCRAYVCIASTGEPVIGVFNYNNTAGTGRAYKTLGWSLLNASQGIIMSTTGSVNECSVYGTIWYRYSSYVTNFSIQYATLSTGVTIFEIYATAAPITISALSNFITTLSLDGVTIATTIGRIQVGTYSLSLGPANLYSYIGTDISRNLPTNLFRRDVYLNSPTYHIPNTDVKIDHFGVFSGLMDSSRVTHKVFTADDNISRIVTGLPASSNVYWEPFFVV